MEEGATHVPLGTLDHKCAIKHKNRGPLPDFLTTPSTPSKEFENDCGSMIDSRQSKVRLGKDKWGLTRKKLFNKIQ